MYFIQSCKLNKTVKKTHIILASLLCPINNLILDEAVEFLLQKVRAHTPAYVVEVNVDVVVKMEQDTQLRQIADEADLTLVDGQPLCGSPAGMAAR